MTLVGRLVAEDVRHGGTNFLLISWQTIMMLAGGVSKDTLRAPLKVGFGWKPQIKTKATVNEDPTEALIRELKEQNEKLKAQLASGVVTDADIDVEEDDNLSPAGNTGLF